MTMTAARISALVEKSFQSSDDESLNDICQDIALDIEANRCKVHSVVEGLGPHLTNTDVSLRENSVKTLSLVLSKLPKDFLEESEIQLLTDFYCDRLNDHHSIGPATIIGILAIIQMDRLPTKAPTRLIHGLLQNIRCQSELQETRRNIYLIFQILLKNRTDALKTMGSDFVYGVISAMDGECDPRNLMLLFNFLPTFIKTFPLGHLTEEMFEVVACYFPVDFNATGITSDKNKITRENLARALIPCLCAISEFSEFCIPQVMEKLSSERKIAKIDALELLTEGAPIFRSKGLKHHLNELLPMLKKEIMSNGDEEVKNAALNAISAVVKALADDEGVRKSFVQTIFDKTRWSLCDVKLSLYRPAEKLMETVAAAEKNSCVQVLRDVVPLLLGQYSTKTTSTDKIILMETLNNLIRICGHYGFTIADIPELAWADIPGLYMDELATNDGNLKAKTLTGLIIQKSALNKEQRSSIYNNVCREIDSDTIDETRKTCHSLLLNFGKLYPDELLEVLDKSLQMKIVDPTILRRRLEAISTVAKIRRIGTKVIPRILDIAISNDSTFDELALTCLTRLLHSPNNDFDAHNYLYKECRAMERLMSCDRGNPEKLLLVSGLCRLIVRKLSTKDQLSLVNDYISSRTEKFIDRQVIIVEGIITALRPNVPIENMKNLLMEFTKLAVGSDVSDVRNSSCKIIAVLLNKMEEDENFRKIATFLRERTVDTLESDDSDVTTKKSAITLHTWLTKCLVIKGSVCSQDFLDYQINIIRMEQIGNFVAEEFKSLVDKSEDTLTEMNFCTIKIFYKQRIFQRMIESNVLFVDEESRRNYLIALTHLVKQVPIELSIMHLEKLVPLLIECLSLNDGRLLISTLKTLTVLLETRHEIFLSQIQCFIPRCLQLSTLNNMNVRIAALECLFSYCNYPVVELLKYKQNVLDVLGDAVDDQKRLVRQIAVKARTRWYLVGAPGMPDEHTSLNVGQKISTAVRG